MLQEIAAWVMYHKDKASLDRISVRLKPEERKNLYEVVEKNRLQEGLSDGYFMGVEMVMYLKKVDYFKNIKGLLLCDLVDKMINSNLNSGEKLIMPQNEEDERIYVVAEGEAFLKNDNKEVKRLRKGEVFGRLFNNEDKIFANELEAFGKAVIFHISVYDFYNVMADHHELAQGFIKNIGRKQDSEIAD